MTFFGISIILFSNISIGQINDLKIEKNNLKTLTYDIIVPDDYPTIQEAINNAQNGNHIFVRRGNYEENIDINKIITLEGESMDFTNISGVNDDHVIDIKTD